MKYTIEQYKQLIKEYCEEMNCAPNIQRALNKENIYKSDILNNDDQDLMTVLSGIILGMSKRSKTYDSLKWNKQVIANFIFWCYNKKLIDFNPFDDRRLQAKFLLGLLKDSLDIKLYTPEDIENIISCLKQDSMHPIYEVLIRLFYEGIPTNEYLIGIKNADFKNNIIQNDSIKINISKELQKAILCYKDLKEVDGAKRTIYLYEQNDMLIKTATIKKECPEFDKKKFQINISSNYFNKNISRIVGYSVYPKDLYVSGFVNYFKKITNNDEELFYNTFLGLKNMRPDSLLLKQLSDIQYEYNGIREPGHQIRERVMMYIKKL